MKSNAVYIIPDRSVFNPEVIKYFESFKKEDSLLLYSSLYLNLVENFIDREYKADIYCILDELDKEFVSNELKNTEINILFENVGNKKRLFDKLALKEFSPHKNNLIIFSDLMGINLTDADKYFKLLNIEDESLLIGRSKDNCVVILGFNKYSEEVFTSLLNINFNYDELLIKLSSLNYFIHTVKDILRINNLNDFKKLYDDLSQKKSIEYCSQQMHEKFTHLFVEYKELLK